MGDTTDLVIAQRPRPEIERAMQFIVEHLERRFTVADVAGAIGLSEFHLHRLLHTAVGESVGRFFTRKRLELAALRLAYEPHTPITTIALESGYSSSSNFSKAFSGSRNESRAATTAGDEGGDNLARRRLRLAQCRTSSTTTRRRTETSTAGKCARSCVPALRFLVLRTIIGRDRLGIIWT